MAEVFPPAPAAAVGEKNKFVMLGVADGTVGPRVVRRWPRPEVVGLDKLGVESRVEYLW